MRRSRARLRVSPPSVCCFFNISSFENLDLRYKGGSASTWRRLEVRSGDILSYFSASFVNLVGFYYLLCVVPQVLLSENCDRKSEKLSSTLDRNRFGWKVVSVARQLRGFKS